MAQVYRRDIYDRARIRAGDLRASNPWPNVSWPEAIVRLELNRRNVEYSYRYFKPEWSPTLAKLITDPPYHPEFTLPRDKIVIIVLGTFWGTIPGILDRVSLAKAVLQFEGWRVVVWHEVDILSNVIRLFTRDLKSLDSTKHTRGEIINPYEPLLNFRQRLLEAVAKGRKLIIKSRGTRHRNGRRNRRSGSRRYRRNGSGGI